MKFAQTILALSLLMASGFSQGVNQPNVLLILVDDLGWRDLSSYGSSLYEMPNIDQLANHGLRFNQAVWAASLCSPTRLSHLSES